MAETPNLRLPMLVTAQAQKEVTHNEALILIDAILGGKLEDDPLDNPPTLPQSGQCWIVGENPEDAWLGHEKELAIWTEGGWRFITPKINMYMHRADDGTKLHFDGIDWKLPPEILRADGGVTVDVEVRTVLAELLQLLEGHGLVKTA